MLKSSLNSVLKQVSWHFCYPAGYSLQHAWQSWKLWNTSKTRCKIWRFGYRRIFHSKDPLSNFQNPNFGSKSSCTFRAAKNSFSHTNRNTQHIFSHTKEFDLRHLPNILTNKVNSVQEACAKCFAVHLLKFEILQTTWKMKDIKMLNLLVKNWKLRVWCSLFHFFHVICKIFDMRTTNHLVQPSCTELTLTYISDCH